MITPGKWMIKDDKSIVTDKGWEVGLLNPYSPERDNAIDNGKLITASPLLLDSINCILSNLLKIGKNVRTEIDLLNIEICQQAIKEATN